VSQKGRVELGGGRNCFSILVSRLIPCGYMGVVVLKASLPKVILYRNVEAWCDFLLCANQKIATSFSNAN
jgi:hypothetical protein